MNLTVRSADSITGILDAIRSVDPSFAPTPSESPNELRFCSTCGAGFDVRLAGGDSEDGASRFTQFLIAQPVASIVLHGPGIPVIVPAPERFAIYSLATAGRDEGTVSGMTDFAQNLGRTAELIEALWVAGRERSLAQVLAEVQRWDPAWRTHVEIGIQSLYDACGVTLP